VDAGAVEEGVLLAVTAEEEGVGFSVVWCSAS